MAVCKRTWRRVILTPGDVGVGNLVHDGPFDTERIRGDTLPLSCCVTRVSEPVADACITRRGRMRIGWLTRGNIRWAILVSNQWPLPCEGIGPPLGKPQNPGLTRDYVIGASISGCPRFTTRDPGSRAIRGHFADSPWAPWLAPLCRGREVLVSG